MNGIIITKSESNNSLSATQQDNDEGHVTKDNDPVITSSSPSLVIPAESSSSSSPSAKPSESTGNDCGSTPTDTSTNSKETESCSEKKDGDPPGESEERVRTPGKRVRFSVCEYITETLVQENNCNGNGGAHENPSFEGDENMNSANNSFSDSEENGGAKIRYIHGKRRRDSVHPLVSQNAQDNADPWDVNAIQDDDKEEFTQVSWGELDTKGKVKRVLIGVSKFLGLLALLYFFVCSLDLLSLGFRLVGGSTAGEIFRQSSILQNPVVGVMIGILTTVLVQSSSTSSSIIVGMVAAGFMDVRLAIPPIMGANIGTSITNTIVSFTQASNRNQFRRAFAAATVLDMFNWITVIVLLPIEAMFGYLYHVSKATVDLLISDSQSGGEIQLLSVITNPFVDLIVQLNDTVLECWATPNCTDADDASLIKEFCKTAKTEIIFHERVVDVSGNEILNIRDVARQEDLQRCDFLFAGTSLSDAAVGAIILISALLVLCFCLVMIVKLLNSVLKGHVASIIKRTLNADIPYVPWITGYLAILIGAVMTFLVQSSSVFTSALTPLVGLGVISLSRVYPLTLGANIGTTTTALLASMAAEGNSLRPSLQIALCHLFFNFTGVLLFYPFPFMRFPIPMARALGNITAKYRWFAIFYLVAMFGILPVIFIGLSLAGSIYVVILVSIVGVIVALVALLTTIQRRWPKILPAKLRSWKFLPAPMRSLEPYDNLVSKLPCCRRKDGDDDGDEDDDDEEGGSGRYKKPGSYKDNDFVFLSGNKIPPPQDYGKEDEEYQQRPPVITRIVPTRVIRNISNGGGEYSQVTENHDGNNSPDVVMNSQIPRPSSGVSDVVDSDTEQVNVDSRSSPKDSISSVGSENNSIPIPIPDENEESPSVSNTNPTSYSNGHHSSNSNGMSSRNNKPPAAYNLAYSNSEESILV